MHGINEYILGTSVSQLHDVSSLREFFGFRLPNVEEEYGIKKTLPGENFYIATNNVFLGRECIHTIVATLSDAIYKVYFRFITPENGEYEKFREDAYDYAVHGYGAPTETRTLSDVPFHRISVWDFAGGNLILEEDYLGASVTYTSGTVLRSRRSILRRIFDR